MKYIIKMALRNIGRNKRRTALSATAISLAVAMVLFMRGYMGGAVDSMFDSISKIETGHVKISHPEYYAKADMMPLEYMVNGFDGGGYEQMMPVLESIQDIKAIAPRIKFGVLLSYNGKNRSAVGLGIDPKRESIIVSFDKIMVEGEYLGTDENARSIIIGRGLASKLGIKSGDKLTIVSRTAYDSLRGMTFKVTGIFSYNISILDDKLFYIPIGSAARLLEMGNGVSEIILMINKPEEAEKVADQISREFEKKAGNATRYAIIPWQKHEGFLSMINSVLPMYNFIFLGLLVLASTVIINTTMMVIYERMREIGTMGALGMKGGQIVLLFTLESAIVSAIGSFAGMITGGGLDLLFSIVGINIRAITSASRDMPIDIIYPRFGLPLLLWSFIFGIVIASIFAYIPARRSAKVEPVEALRSV